MEESINNGNGDLNSFEVVNKSDVENDEVTDQETEGEWLDILGSGQLKKKILKKGDPDTRPQRGEICIISGYAKLEDDTIVDTFENSEICVGDAELIHGMDFVLPLMDIGEESEIIIGPRFGYGEIGCPEKNIPPNATVYYQITLNTVQPELDIPELSSQRRLELGSKKKERGNWWFSRSDNSLAVQCYRKALEFLDSSNLNTTNASKEELDNFVKERINVYNNLAMAQIKLESYDSALMSLENVFAIDPKNVKALYRKAKILKEKNEPEEAIKLFKMIPSYQTTPSMQRELSELLNQQKSNVAKQKELYQKMFSKPVSDDEKDKKKPSSNLNKILLIVGFTVLGLVTGGLILRYYYTDLFEEYFWSFD